VSVLCAASAILPADSRGFAERLHSDRGPRLLAKVVWAGATFGEALKRAQRVTTGGGVRAWAAGLPPWETDGEKTFLAGNSRLVEARRIRGDVS